MYCDQALREIKRMKGRIDDYSEDSLDVRFLKGTPWVLKDYKKVYQNGVTQISFWIGLTKFMYLCPAFGALGTEIMNGFKKEELCFYFDTKTGELIDETTAQEFRNVLHNDSIQEDMNKLEERENDKLEEERRKDEEEIHNIYTAMQAELFRIIECENDKKARREKKTSETEQQNKSSSDNFIKERNAEAQRKKVERETMMKRSDEIIHNARECNNNNSTQESFIGRFTRQDSIKRNYDNEISPALIAEYHDSEESQSKNEIDEIMVSLIKVIEEYISMKSFKRAKDAIDFFESSFPNKQSIACILRQKIPKYI